MSDDTAQAISERSLRDRAAFHVLLDALLEYVDARADTPEAQTLADESVKLVWMSGLDGRGPDTALLLWLAEHPEIWRRTLPDDVVIAPRKLIADIVACLPPSPLGGLGALGVDDIERIGNDLLTRHAHVAQRARLLDDEREPERIRAHLTQIFSPKD